MKTIRHHWAKLAGATSLATLALFLVLHACQPARGATPPTLIMKMTGTNQAQLTVSNGTFNATFLLYHRQFLEEATPWIVLTNGAANQTNFTVTLPPETTTFYEAEYSPSNYPFTLTMTILTPANGANIQ